MHDALLDIHSATRLDRVLSALMQHLPGLVPLSSGAYFHVSADGYHFSEVISAELDRKLFTAYSAYYEQYDVYKQLVFDRFPMPPVDRSSDYMDYAEWEKSPHRSDFLIPNGMYHLAGIQVLVGQQLVADVCLHREQGEQDFSDDEMAVVLAMQRHVSLASRNCLLFGSAWGDHSDLLTTALAHEQHGVVIFDKRLRPVYRNTTATGLCERFCEESGASIGLLTILSDLLQQRRSMVRQAPSQVHAPSWNGRVSLPGYTLNCTVLTVRTGNGITHYIVYFTAVSAGEEVSTRQPLPFNLSRREYEIARQVAQGMSNIRIALSLNISINTVKTHLKHLMAKTGSHTRAEAIYRLFGQQITTQEPPDTPESDL
ncbi:MAG: helix-turn-helix domain-containing protein [Armatimonadota bacterium]